MPRQKTKKRLYRKKCGGENTSPNTKAAKRIQSRFRGNKDRKVAKIKKLNKSLEEYNNYDVLNMIKMHMTGRGKKKKSKKLTNKKRSKKRSVKQGG